jgi:1-acyl-sn-glycerol-3-phosphate acyltransferase
MRGLLRFLYLLFAFPLLGFFKPRLSFDDPRRRFFRPKGPLLLLVKGQSKHDFLCLSLLAFFHPLHPFSLHDEERGFKRFVLGGISFEDDLDSFFQKKRVALVLIRNKEDEESAYFLAKKVGVPLQLATFEGTYGFFKRPRLTFGNVFSLDSQETENAFSARFADLSRLGEFYQKYHAFGTFHGTFFLMDLARILVLPKLALIYPTTYLYESPEAKKNRHLKKEGLALSNHVAFADAAMLPRVYPFRRIRMVVGDIVYRNNGKLMHFWLKEAHVLHVSDAEGDPALSFTSLVEAQELLRCHTLLGIFPEGKINWKGEMGQFYSGAAGLALLSGTLLYPSVTLRPYRAFHRQIVVVGNPIDLRKELKEGESISKPTLDRLAQLLENKLKSLREASLEQIAKKKKQ